MTAGLEELGHIPPSVPFHLRPSHPPVELLLSISSKVEVTKFMKTDLDTEAFFFFTINIGVQL